MQWAWGCSYSDTVVPGLLGVGVLPTAPKVVGALSGALGLQGLNQERSQVGALIQRQQSRKCREGPEKAQGTKVWNAGDPSPWVTLFREHSSWPEPALDLPSAPFTCI